MFIKQTVLGNLSSQMKVMRVFLKLSVVIQLYKTSSNKKLPMTKIKEDVGVVDCQSSF